MSLSFQVTVFDFPLSTTQAGLWLGVGWGWILRMVYAAGHHILLLKRSQDARHGQDALGGVEGADFIPLYLLLLCCIGISGMPAYQCYAVLGSQRLWHRGTAPGGNPHGLV